MRTRTPSEVRGTSIAYRPELDGIRGLAILIIVLHHMGYVGKHYLGGRGFLAVDIFFALSGFLITQILLSYSERAVGLRTFYRRRVARLYPVLLLSVVGVSAYFSGDWNFPSGWPAVQSVLYIKNFYHWGGVLGPLWSLAAEEQFYLIFPLILLLGLKFLKRNRLTALLIIWLVVVWIAGWKSSAPSYDFNKDGAFNLVVFRPSIILVGALIALHKVKLEHFVARYRNLFYAWLVIFIFFTITTQFPPLAGISTGLLILILSEPVREICWFARGLYRALSFKPLAWLGLLSYSIYIWHLPLIFISSHRFTMGSVGPLWLFLAKLLACAVVSFYLIERPLLKLFTKHLRNPRLVHGEIWSK